MENRNDNEMMDERRLERRKRRRRNQIAAYAGVVLVLAVLGVGLFLGIRSLTRLLKENMNRQEETETEVVETTQEDTLPEEETETEIVEYTEEDLLNEVVESCISEMTLEDKVAGLFIVTPEAITGTNQAVKAGDGTKEALDKYPVGGLVYFKQNIQSQDQITEMLANTVSMSKYPIFLAVDEEGGKVTRVAEALKLDNVGKMQAIGETGDVNNAYTAYQTIGTYLCQYGFNLDFAPVADVLTNPDNTAIGERSFGSDAQVVSSMVSSAVGGLKDTGITACLKHFPGQGGADGDTHEGLASTQRTLEEMRETEFKPFQAGIEAGAQMIMVGHISAPQVTGDNTPSSLSKMIVTDILRGELNYDGVVITDALNMSAISEYYGSDEACIKALKAGCDMLLMPEDFEAAYEGVIAAVKDGTISEERIDDSLARVYRIKYAGTIKE